MNLNLRASGADITPSRNMLSVDVQGADPAEILDQFTALEVLEHFGEEALLVEIGIIKATQWLEDNE